MKKLKSFFFARLLREKLLLTAFLALGALLWLSSLSGRWSAFGRAWRGVSADLADEQQWLASRARIETDAKKAAAHLDPAKTLDGAALVGELNAIAGQAGLANTSCDEVRIDRSGQFAVNSVRFTVQRTDLASLLQFYAALVKRSPYVGVEQCALMADRVNPALLSATFRISAVEIVKAGP